MNRVELVLDSLRLKVERRKGRRVWLLCPWHRDHSATNFYVVISGRTAGLCHCFSCKKGGSLVDLVMRVRGGDLASAKAFIDLLGKGYQPPKAKVRVVSRTPLLGRKRFVMPSEVCFEALEEWVKPAREYAIGRGITSDEVKQFRIGYAVDGKLGGRIILPWIGRTGTFGGYSARSFVGDEPKYLTPHESENPDPGIMFGEHAWVDNPIVVITEGALNSLAARRVLDGIDIAALGGSEVNSVQAIKLSRYKKAIDLTDPDPAGDKVSKQLEMVLGRYTKIVRVRLPTKKVKGETVKMDALDVGPVYLKKVLLEAVSKLDA